MALRLWPPPLPEFDPHDDIAPWVGRAAIRYNHVQFWVFVIFRRLLLNAHDIAHAIFFTLKSDAAQRDITTELARVQLARYPKLRDELQKALKDINAAAGKRNDIMHAIILYDFKTHRYRIPWPEHHRLKGKNLRSALEKTGKEFLQLDRRLAELTKRVDKAMKAKSERDLYVGAIAPALKAFLPREEQATSPAEGDPQSGQRETRRQP